MSLRGIAASKTSLLTAAFAPSSIILLSGPIQEDASSFHYRKSQFGKAWLVTREVHFIRKAPVCKPDVEQTQFCVKSGSSRAKLTPGEESFTEEVGLSNPLTIQDKN